MIRRSKMATSNPHQFTYMMLSRLKMDCDYFLGYGKASEAVLYTGGIQSMIDKMLMLWYTLPDDAKPEWLPMTMIADYKNRMVMALVNRG
jgi:hypothetical protein